MPRRSGGPAPRRAGPPAAPARPQVAPPRPAPQQTRPATTAAGPPATQQGQRAGSQGPGLFGQMASTAAGVAVGSSIGHAVGGWFGGGSAPVEQANATAAAQDQYNQQTGQRVCEHDVNAFRKCMDDNQGSLTICGWYLDQLKACQAAASQY